jgi:MFS family permease
VLLASLMGVGIAAGTYWALSQAAAPPELIGRALGFQNMVAQFAGAAAPLLTGILLGSQQDFRTAILVAGLCPLVALVAIVVLVQRPQIQAREAQLPDQPKSVETVR